MLASTLGIELDPDKDWNERKMVYQVGERQFVSRSTAQTARGHKDGLWTTVIAGAVMLCYGIEKQGILLLVEAFI
jgi:arginine decarboxylase